MLLIFCHAFIPSDNFLLSRCSAWGVCSPLLSASPGPRRALHLRVASRRDVWYARARAHAGVQQSVTLRKAMAIECPDGGGRLFDCVQATWNLLEQSAGEQQYDIIMSVCVSSATGSE